jgi:hypothetical protein
MNTEAAPEPTGVCLKAAYLLLRELKRYPNLPSMEELALILADVLHYEWAARLLRLEEENHDAYGVNDGVIDFNLWANDVLVGADFRSEREAEEPPEVQA